MYSKLLSFLYLSRSEQQSTHQCYIHDVTESVFVREDCLSNARPRIKNRQRLESLRRLSHRLKSLVRCRPYSSRQSVAGIETRNDAFNKVKLQVTMSHCSSPVNSGSHYVRMIQNTSSLHNTSTVTAL